MKAVNQIILINFVVYSLTFLLECNGFYLNNVLALFPISSSYFSGYQLITHLFAHANYTHLISNMFILFAVGYDVEKILGKSKFWNFYILSGLSSSGLYSIGSSHPIIGASGAIFSVVALSIVSNWSVDIRRWYLVIKNLFFLSLILLEFFYSIFLPQDDIGHLAHIFGSIFGIIYYLYLKKLGFSK